MDFNGVGAETVTLLNKPGNVILAAGNNHFTPVFDARASASYYLTVTATTQTFPATGYNTLSLEIFWYADAAALTTVATEYAEIWTDGVNPFGLSFGPLNMHDIMHGPYMSIVFTNTTATTDSVNYIYNLYGTTRVVPSPFFRQQNAPDMLVQANMLSLNVPASNSIKIPCSFAYGHVQTKLVANAANLTASLFFGSLSPAYATYTVPNAAPGFLDDIIAPKRSLLWQVNNGNATPQTVNIDCVAELQRK